MRLKRNICENCRTGREAYELDSNFPMCPYIASWENNKCNFYKPINAEEESIFIKILKKLRLL